MSLIAILDKWPSFLEVHQEVEDGPITVHAVVERGNNRPLSHDQLRMLQTLEQLGAKVFIRAGNVDITLAQFERTGVWSSRPRVIAQSTFYNKQAELKRLEQVLAALPTDAPEREEFTARRNHLKAVLGITEDVAVPQEKVQESDEKLNTLQFLLYSKMKDEDFIQVPFGKLLKDLPNNEQRTALLVRHATLTSKKGDNNAEPTVEVEVKPEQNPGQ